MKIVTILTRTVLAIAALGLLYLGLMKFVLLPKNSNYIPEDAAMVATFRMGSLLRKADYKQLMESNEMKQILDKIKESRSPIADWIDDPKSTGLDWMGTTFVAVTPPKAKRRYDSTPVITIILPLKNSKNTEEALGDWWKSEYGESIQLHEEDGITLVKAYDDNSDMQIGLNKRALVIAFCNYGTIDPYYIYDLLAQNSAPDHQGLKSWLRERCDMGCWVDYNAFFETINENYQLDTDVAQGLGIKFKRGRMEIISRNYYGDGNYAKISGNGVPVSLINSLPNDSILAGTLSLDLEGIYEVAKDGLAPVLKQFHLGDVDDFDAEIKSEFGFSIEDFIDTFSGNFAFAFTGLNAKTRTYTDWEGYAQEYEDITPSFVFAGQINDTDQWDDIVDELEDEEVIEKLEKEGYDLFDRKGKTFYLCSDDLTRELKHSGNAKKRLPLTLRLMLSRHDSSLYLNIERLVDLLEDQGADEEIVEIFGLFQSATLVVDAHKRSARASLSLQMSNKKKNSLATLLEYVLDTTPAPKRNPLKR